MMKPQALVEAVLVEEHSRIRSMGMDTEAIVTLLLILGLLAFAGFMIWLGLYSVGLQRKATKTAIPKTIELQERSIANQEESKVRVARSLELQEQSMAMYQRSMEIAERSLSLQEETLVLQREATALLRTLNEKLEGRNDA
jgi:signal transduction histidine kinase